MKEGFMSEKRESSSDMLTSHISHLDVVADA